MLIPTPTYREGKYLPMSKNGLDCTSCNTVWTSEGKGMNLIKYLVCLDADQAKQEQHTHATVLYDEALVGGCTGPTAPPFPRIL